MSAAVLIFNFTGADSRTAAQSISLPGAKVGDTVLFVANATNGIISANYPFEAGISVADQIQQNQSGNFGNLSGQSLRAMLVRS